MVRVRDLVAGDQLLCWMRLGYALKQGRYPTGEVYRYAPDRAGRAEASDIIRFAALVMSNDTVTGNLSLTVTPVSSLLLPYTESHPATIGYAYFKRIRRYSKHSYEPKAERPTRKAIGTAFKPYRLLEEVSLV